MKYFQPLVILLLCLITSTNVVNAQKSQQKKDTTKVKKIEFSPIPYISYDRTMGGVFGALPMIMYKTNANDTISPKSISGMAAVYTTNESWGGFAFNKLYFKEDKYRLILVGGKGNFNSQLFSEEINSYLDYNSDTFYFKFELQRLIIKHFYGGINYQFLDRSTIVDYEGATTQIDRLNILGLIFSYDTRDSVYYPTTGFLSELKIDSAPEFFGNDENFNKFTFNYNKYISLKNNRDLIAARIYTGVGLGDLSFNQQFVVSGTDIRGYTQGRYRGKQIVALQGEYRYNPWKKMGLVGFTGLATVFNGDNTSDNGVILPSIGAGFRYAAFPKNKMNVGLEAAVGKGDWGVYFRIGEVF
ncbi:MAG: BamA/TamA family outer membrane protein [Flavobacteriaceae bacterium]|nr:BamA/TamA family outer membrane protein [Flavobacteriaceae bacterium]